MKTNAGFILRASFKLATTASFVFENFKILIFLLLISVNSEKFLIRVAC